MNQAQQFNALMCGIWSDAVDDLSKDAILQAQIYGAKPTEPAKPGDDDGSEWLFPDGSTAHIITHSDGEGIGVILP